MTQNNEREAFEKWFKTWMPETYSQHINNEDIEATRRYYSAWLAWKARAQSQNEQQPKQIPDGYKLVPIEPTYKMLSAVLFNTEYAGDNESLMTTAYKAMINASPTNTEVGNESKNVY